MALLAELEPMAKKVGRPRKAERYEGTVKIDDDLLTKAKFTARTRDESVAEYLTNILRGPVEKQFAEAVKKLDGQG